MAFRRFRRDYDENSDIDFLVQFAGQLDLYKLKCLVFGFLALAIWYL
jgi:predicted nucleotidyltransferase